MHALLHELLDEARLPIANLGFRLKGSKFVAAHDDDTVVLIDFQISSKTTRSLLVFTVNVGSHSLILQRELVAVRGLGRPTHIAIESCHWWQRLGYLVPSVKTDKWWEVANPTQARSTAREILGHLRSDEVLSIVRRIETTASLLQLWKEHKGTTSEETQDLYVSLLERLPPKSVNV